MELTFSEKDRYNRHLIIDNFGEKAQQKLKAAKVIVIGAGGLGCPVLQYLVAAGIGEITIVDGDVVSLSNLQRQILFTESEIGCSKAQIAVQKMSELNSQVQIKYYDQFLDEELALRIFEGTDIVVGATDNFNSRYLIDKISRFYTIPFVYGSIYEFEGQVSVFNYKGGKSYSSLFENKPAEPSNPVGVIGAIPGIIGSLMALEVIKIVSCVGEVLSDKLLLYNALENSFQQINL